MSKKNPDTLKYTRVKPVSNALISILFIILALMAFLPAVFVLIISLSSESSIYAVGFSFFPQSWSLEAYEYLARQAGIIGRSFLNSIGITVVGTVIGLIMCSTMGYSLSRPNYKFRGFFTWFIFIPMLFSGGMVASYMINAQILKLKNTYWALILPICCSSFYIVIMRTFFQTTVPMELIEAATIDGCNQFQVFFHVILPLTKPILVTMAVLAAVWTWNDLLVALIAIDQMPLMTLTRRIQNFIGFQSGTEWDFFTASVTLAMVPIIILYGFLQKYVQSGITAGAVKG